MFPEPRLHEHGKALNTAAVFEIVNDDVIDPADTDGWLTVVLLTPHHERRQTETEHRHLVSDGF